LRGSIKGESQKNMTVVPIFAQKTLHVEEIEPSEELKKSEEPQKTHSSSTLDLATQDVRIVIEEQKQQGHLLTTKLNILFVVNGALFTTLMISRLVLLPSIFSFGEIFGFFVNFSLLINAFLPRQVAVSPNLGDTKFLERYLALTPEEYQLQMMVNQVATYNTNKQRLDDVSQSLTYAAYVTWTIALTILLHMVWSYFVQGVKGI
jgi:hypothetical protein